MPYGMPYKGSKSRIAERLLSVLPAGRRFVDLFGGGGAMAHAAALSGKYEAVLYNEILPHIAALFERAINGGFRDFIPRWISRGEFHAKKETDGYVATCWSFANNLRDYMFSAELEPIKKRLFEYIVGGELSPELFGTFPEAALRAVTGDTVHTRYLSLKKQLREYGRRADIEPLERLGRLQRLERLDKLQALAPALRCDIAITSGSYEDYIYQPHDVVYCDIPYEETNKYITPFDWRAFYAWALSRPYPVYISSYDAPLACVYERPTKSLMSYQKRHTAAVERLYINKEAAA